MTFSQWAEARMLNPVQRAIALRAWRASREATLIECQKQYNETMNIPNSSQFSPTNKSILPN